MNNCITCGIYLSSTECDNRCSTQICDKGHEQYFSAHFNKVISGHNPKCDEDDQEEPDK
jgi:hypothetical protein